MRDLILLFIHLIATIARLLGPAALFRGVESLLVSANREVTTPKRVINICVEFKKLEGEDPLRQVKKAR
jgi:hypothetical protein